MGSIIGYEWWTEAASKAKPLMDPKVRHEDAKKGFHDVRSFIGACNFYRRHIKNFTLYQGQPEGPYQEEHYLALERSTATSV